MPSIVRNILALFTERDRVRFARVTAAVVVSAILETVTVLAILPFMTVVADPESVFGTGMVGRLYAGAGSPERATFLLMMGGVVLGLVVLSNAMSAIATWRLGRFVWDKYHDLAGSLLLTYLRQPYPFFLGRNSADLSKNILSEVEVAMTGVVIPVLYTFARGILALFILGLLVAVDAQVAVVAVVVVGGSYAITYAVLRGRLGRFGQARLDANEQRFQAAAEALSGVKAVKILGREETFLRRFVRPSAVFAKATANREVLSVVPRYVLEAVAFGGITALMMVVLLRPGGPEAVLPTLALYGFAGLKLMPALQQVFASFATSRFYAPALARLREELEGAGSAEANSGDHEEVAFQAAERDAVVALNGLSYQYPGASASSLQDVTLEVRRGGVYGFVGRTGSGKTTAMDVILGLLPPSEGEVRVLGRPLVPGIADAWRRRVGYVPQDIFLTDESIASNIALGVAPSEIDRDRVAAVVDLVELAEMVDGLPEGVDTEVGERGVRLSGGQRQRIGIARALYHRPDILVFDEGTSALDSATEAAILGRLGDLGVTVLWVTHRISTAKDFDRIFVFADGRLVGEGSHEALLAECAEYRRLAGSEPED